MGYRSRVRRRGQLAAGYFFLVLAAIMALGLIQGCGKRVEVDPRDEAAVAAGESGCDRRSASVNLKIVNRSAFDIVIRVHRGSGGGQSLRPAVFARTTTTKRVSRSLLSGSGWIELQIVRGGLHRPQQHPIHLTPLMCNVGTLMIAADPNMSMYGGADL